MLESPGLLLEWPLPGAVPHPGAPGTAIVRILDPNSFDSLGLARRAANAGGWFGWRRSHDLEVCEGEDLSITFSLRRYWFLTPFWMLDDAEGNRVANLFASRRRPPRFDRSISGIVPLVPERSCGQLREMPVANASVSDAEEYTLESQLLSAGGHELAHLHYARSRTLLWFAKTLEGDPFTRMLAVAAALLWRR
jgi:hypothetical protein